MIPGSRISELENDVLRQLTKMQPRLLAITKHTARAVKHPYLVAAASAVCVLAGLIGLMVLSGKAAVASFVLAAAPLLSGLAPLISKRS